MTSKPRGRPDVLTRSSPEQRLLYDRSTNSFHVLNETAEFIWNLCDGKHSLEDMERELRESFDIPANLDVTMDIQRTLASLEKKGLLVSDHAESETTH